MIIEKTNLNLLALDLIARIQKRSNPFSTITIIVPNLLIEQWLKSYWLRNSNMVLMNVSFKRLRPFLNETFNISKKELINQNRLSVLIIKELIENKDEYPEFANYISLNDEINSINLYDISKKLAKIYDDYEKDEFEPIGEEEKLLKNIKSKNSDCVFLSDLINNDIKFTGEVFVFGFRKVHKLYLHALEKLNCFIYKQIQSPKNIEMPIVYSCASMEREIEFIHGEICKLLNDKNERLYNIMVYCPNLALYEPIIKKVFFSSDNETYPEVPYAIINSDTKASNAALVIKLLYDILCKEQLTRANLINLITNSNVARARNIDLSLINPIIKAIDDMNVYRNHKKSNEWQYAIKRLLAAKLIGDSYNMDNTVFIDNGDKCEEYLPYGSISLPDEAIIVLASAIEDIIFFIETFKNNKTFNPSDLKRLKIELDKWLYYSDTEPNFYYNAAVNSLSNYIEKNVEVPREIVFLSMIEASQNISVYPTNIINGSITFIDLKEDNIVQAKYMFFIGMSSNNTPRKTVLNELDYRSNVETLAEIDKEIFNLLQNNSENIYVSYVNLNLQTLEDYFPSSLYMVKKENIKHIGLLETRDYSELFTKREIEKKNYNLGLYNTFDNNPKGSDSPSKIYPKYKYPEFVKYKQMSSYLNENLLSKMELLFKEYDEENNANLEYEPIEIDNLVKSNIEKSFLYKMIADGESQLDDYDRDCVIREYKLLHLVPYADIDNDIEEMIIEAKKYYDALPSGFNLNNGFSVDISTIIDNNALFYNLNVNTDYLLSEIEEDDIITLRFDFARVKTISKVSDALDLYIIALAYLSSLHNDIEYNICLGSKYSFKCQKSIALMILNNIYRDMFDFSDAMIKPLDVFNGNEEIDLNDINYRSIESLFINSFKFNELKKLISFRDDAGYTFRSFNNELKKVAKYINDNVLYIHIVKEDE